MEQSLHVNNSQFDTPEQVEPGILPPTVPTTATQKRAIPPVPTEVPLPCDLSGNRIFLDVCSGVSQPLSAALKQFNADTLAFDILINPQSNLLDDAMFDRLLRLCASGMIGYCASAPSVHESSIMLERCTMLSRVTFRAGGHAHLEQPPSAMSWQEPFVEQFLLECNCSCIAISACQYGLNWNTSWLLASTFPALTALASKCDHPPGTHDDMADRKDESGQFISRLSATYPVSFCSAFAELVYPLLSCQNLNLEVPSAERLIPVKHTHDLPHARNDGAGFHSHADWSEKNHPRDPLCHIRKKWMSHIMDNSLDRKLIAHISQKREDPPFSNSDIAPLKALFSEFLEAHGIAPDWTIPADQPMHLHVLHQLCQLVEDPDTELFQLLIKGVPIGIDDHIPRSNCFPEASPKDVNAPDSQLSIHHCNWSSAEDNPEIVEELIQKELAEGWVREFPGDLADAQQRWPKGLAVGKLGLALSESRPPRLVLDNTICGVNHRCTIPEKATLPSAMDVKRSFPLREQQSPLDGFSLDIRSAHKRIAVAETDRGFLLFKFRGRYFYYTVCPFGAVFSAHYWARLGGVLLRIFHLLTFLSHAAFLFVDDLLMMQDATVLPVTAAMLCIFCQITQVPISWKKCELGPRISWIGWHFDLKVGLIYISKSKREKLLSLTRKLLHSDKCTRKSIEQFLGLSMWITQLFRHMRPWLHVLYHDLDSFPASHYSINSDSWNEIHRCLNNDLIFISVPPSSAIPVGAKLLQVRHQSVSTKADLVRCHIPDKRIWLRLRHPGSTKRRISPSSHQVLQMYETWLQYLSPFISMWPRQKWSGLCVADAFAQGSRAGIGGIVYFPSGKCSWFSLPLELSDFRALHIPMHDDLQKDISSLELLAQLALIWVVIHSQPGFRISIRIPTLSDNSAAESTSNSLFTTAMPLALFAEKLCHRSLLQVWKSILPTFPVKTMRLLMLFLDGMVKTSPRSCCKQDRIHCSLSELWISARRPRLVPSDTWLPWPFPGLSDAGS